MPILGNNEDYSRGRARVKTAPAFEPVTLDYVKTVGRIDGNHEDAVLNVFIQAAREAAESYMGRSMVYRTMVYSMDAWPGMTVSLPYSPLASIVEVRIVEEDGTYTSYASAYFYVDNTEVPGQLVVKDGATWPTATETERARGGYEIEYVAGYCKSAVSRADIPAMMRHATAAWAVAIYEQRATTEGPPPDVKKMLDAYRVIKI